MTRFFDILFSLLAIIILAPVLLPVIIILRVTGEGEIFYFQNRVGRHGIDFKLLKFATMLKNSPSIGTGNITIKHDPRVLPFGRILRKSKINELPQLFNILLGQMSFVGPRPLTRDNFDYYPSHVKAAIGEMRPGLTGIGSIFFRDEESILDGLDNPRSFYRLHITPYKADLEIWYRENKNIFLYFKIIFVTALVVVRTQISLHTWFPAIPMPGQELSNRLVKIDDCANP